MQIRPTEQTSKGPPERFTGDAWFDMIVTGVEPSRIRSSIVHFAPGARNAWHVHVVGQTLYVIDGVGRVQARGGEVLEIRPGDVVHTPPGEWHWHGASPDRFMSHLTIYEAPEKGPESEWGDHVGDAEYLATPGSPAVTTWSPDELERIGRATELQVASRRSNGSLRPYVTIWVVGVGDDLYVRWAHGPTNGWYRRAKAAGAGRIRAGGVERDVSFEEPARSVAPAVTAAYHAKYDRYGPAIVGTVVSPDGERSTLRIVPR